jgi:hypothetical protein
MHLSVLTVLVSAASVAAASPEPLHCVGECQHGDTSDKGQMHQMHMKMHEDEWAYMKVFYLSSFCPSFIPLHHLFLLPIPA